MKRQPNIPLRTVAKRTLLRTLLPLCFLGTATIMNAQTIVPPSNPDNTFTAVSSFSGTINNAVLDYNTPFPGQLMATAYDDGGNVNCSILDYPGAIPVTVTMSPPSGYIASRPDVILGGDNLPGTSQFYFAVVYLATNNTLSITNVFMQTGIINNPGTGSMTVHLCPIPIQLSSSGTVGIDELPHIDVIAKDFGPNVVADNFAVTWSENDNIMAVYHSGLAALATSCGTVTTLPAVNITAPYGVHGDFSDVAGVERMIGGSVHDIILFSFIRTIGGGTAALMYQEWDVTGMPSTPVVKDPYGGIKFPRIDAIDCHDVNNPANGYANYDIVYNYSNPVTGNWDIKSYNPLSSSDCSNGTFASTGNFYPVVACGPSTQYNIGYFTGSGTSTDDYSQQIDWPTGNLSPNSTTYDLVNSNTGANQIAISSAVNNLIPDYDLVTWYNPTLGEIDYKLTGSPIAYKPTAVSNVNARENGWKLSPNPASDYVVLAATGDNWQNATYQLRDVTGRTVGQGSMTNAQQQINTQSLAAGMYLLNVTAGNGAVSTQKFVKE